MNVTRKPFVHENIECAECEYYGLSPAAYEMELEDHTYTFCTGGCADAFVQHWLSTWNAPRPRRKWAVRLLERALAA